MSLQTGDNTIRVAGFRKGVQGIYDVYQFTVVNLRGDIGGFCYAIPAGSLRPPSIVRDLLELQKRNYWFVAYLKENSRTKLLQIHTIKEPPMPQNECWHIAQKVLPQSPRRFKELTGESPLVTLN